MKPEVDRQKYNKKTDRKFKSVPKYKPNCVEHKIDKNKQMKQRRQNGWFIVESVALVISHKYDDHIEHEPQCLPRVYDAPSAID